MCVCVCVCVCVCEKIEVSNILDFTNICLFDRHRELNSGLTYDIVFFIAKINYVHKYFVRKV